jgi:predicted RNase H-like nuclease (RuvC/YqgF family)
MALDKMEALETRIKGLVELVQSLKRANTALESELRTARERASKQEDQNREWKQERADIKSRIEKVLGDLEILECADGAQAEE